MGNKMETTILHRGLYWDNGKEIGNYYRPTTALPSYFHQRLPDLRQLLGRSGDLVSRSAMGIIGVTMWLVGLRVYYTIMYTIMY